MTQSFVFKMLMKKDKFYFLALCIICICSSQIPVLRQLREIEREAGKDVMLKDQKAEDEDPVDLIKPPRQQRFNRYNNRFRGRGRGFR